MKKQKTIVPAVLIDVKRPPANRRRKPSLAGKNKKSIFHIASVYSTFAVVILLISCVFWAYFSAKLQSTNSDQLVNSYLFENAKTFHNAYIPSAHSYLLKWPLFFLVRLLGLSALALIWVTVLVCVITVGGLAYLLYRIDKRPKLFGTLCLCLASVLLLVPPEPYAGGILPVNMGMLATRNIEYLIYIVALVILIRAARLKSLYFCLGIFVLTVLGASDKLFLTISLGGAALAWVGYLVTRRWVLCRLAARWFIASVLASLLSGGVLWLINSSELTNIIGSLGSSPYAVVQTLRSLGLGVVFGALGILTNFGSNPAFDTAVLRYLPTIAKTRLLHLAAISYATNAGVFLVGLLISLKFYFSSFNRPAAGAPKTDSAEKLAVMLLFSSIAAVGAFVATDHYYVVDARYLSILLFAVFITAAVYLRKRQIKSNKWSVYFGALLVVSIIIGAHSFYSTYLMQNQALAGINQRNELIAQAIAAHPVDTLVGDYWRTIPIKAIRRTIRVTPLEDCINNRTVLSSREWEVDLRAHSFAYLLSFDKSLTNYPSCKLEQILAVYGRPNSSVVVAGKPEKPTELLLFYDQGIHKLTSKGSTQTVLPLTLDQIPLGNCTHTILNVVAHQDDDLLFLSPDLLHSIQARDCVRTIYVTAGDSGQDKLYWLARERGSEAAYSKLIDSKVPWVERTIKIADNQFITLANPKGNPTVSLIFMRLADGNQVGQGFAVSHSESIERLDAGKINVVHSVDSQSSYTHTQLIDAITTLMRIYKPTETRTQAPFNANRLFPDHSDHIAVGKLVAKAYKQYDESDATPLKYYIGYPIKKMPPNVSVVDLELKTASFTAYSQFDPATCHSKTECEEASNYGAYLKRQYLVPSP